MKSNVSFSVRAYWIKVLIAFLTCILFLSLPGCEEKETPEELLIGTWFMESQHRIEYEDGVKTDDYTNNFDPYECTILLQEDGTGKEYRYEGYAYYFSEDTFFWRITYDNPCEGIIIFYRNDEFGQEAPFISFCFTVNESYLTLWGSAEWECYDIIAKEGGSDSSQQICSYEETFVFKRQ
jgi:hypothetical protein